MISLFFACALTLFHARTPQELAWGLMDQQELPSNHALLFHFPSSEQHTFWMFNCYQDLDLFLLDEEGVIVEKYLLKAYPEKLDPNRPVHGLQDFSLYRFDDPILQFFREKSVTSCSAIRYGLEAKAGAFAFEVGDKPLSKEELS